ncbi:hypothetical protein PR003_g3742 [Phytophthora rubi]|uniref:Uncharacterized protein n=1 Tax=Phytophthora rubi TaxID=129364 RepID=A0A6A3P025_9STRA|nr:hypothetical protein PR001_g1590 [Phytophthora rubi]KAE9353667.1 hypothetical protein PR003_g3742 [Phytophthora rubi]
MGTSAEGIAVYAASLLRSAVRTSGPITAATPRSRSGACAREDEEAVADREMDGDDGREDNSEVDSRGRGNGQGDIREEDGGDEEGDISEEDSDNEEEDSSEGYIDDGEEDSSEGDEEEEEASCDADD